MRFAAGSVLVSIASALLVLSSSAQTASATAAPQTPAAHADVAPGSGMHTYQNDTLHLAYSYPAGFTDASAMVGPAFEASFGQETPGKKDEMRCVTVPFSAMNNAGGQLQLVLLARADAGCLKKKLTPEMLPAFTQGEVQGLVASGAHTQFGDPSAFTTQGHAAEMIRGSFTLPTGQALHAMVVCVLLKPDVGCWQFLGSTDASLSTMSAFPVSLDGAAPAPLVPPDNAAKH